MLSSQIEPSDATPAPGLRWSYLSLTGILSLCRRMARLRKERAYLAALDERMLKDVGISRSQAAEEAAKPFWRQ